MYMESRKLVLLNLFSGHQWLPIICLPIKGTQVQSLSQEDPPEKVTATLSSILGL